MGGLLSLTRGRVLLLLLSCSVFPLLFLMPLASGTGLKGRPAFLSPPLSACVRSQRSRRTPADSYSHALLSPSASSKRPVSAYNAAVSRTGGGVDLPVETGRLSSQSDSVRDAKRETQGASIGAETARMKNGTEIVLSIAGERDFVEILDTRNVLSADQLTGLTDFRGQTLDEVPDWDHRKQGFVRRLKTIDRPELSIVVARHKEKNRRPGERESRSEYSIGKRGRGGNASHEHVHGEMLGTADLLELREGNRPKGEVVLLRNVFVQPDARRQGLGRLMTERALREAARRGVTEVVLEVNSNNYDAQDLYESLGFKLDWFGDFLRSKILRRGSWTDSFTFAKLEMRKQITS